MDVTINERTWHITEDILEHIHTLNVGFIHVTLNNIEPDDFDVIINSLIAFKQKDQIFHIGMFTLKRFMRIYKAIDYLNIPVLMERYSIHLCEYIRKTRLTRLIHQKQYLL